MNINKDTEYNLMLLTIHLTEAVKYMTFLVKDVSFNLPSEFKNRFRMIGNTIAPFIDFVFKVLNKDTHEEISLAFDDITRVMLNYPESRDEILIELSKIADRIEKEKQSKLN